MAPGGGDSDTVDNGGVKGPLLSSINTSDDLRDNPSDNNSVGDNNNGDDTGNLHDNAPSSSGNNIVAAAMTKLPADQLAMLRLDFQKVPQGLSLYQFVSVMMKYSERQRNDAIAAQKRFALGSRGGSRGGNRRKIQEEAARQAKEKMAREDSADLVNAVLPPQEVATVADLVELFHQVDVNGDNAMEWDEFTGFIINMAMAARSDVHFHDHWKIRDETPITSQPLAKDRSPIQQVLFVPAINRVLVCTGPMIQIYDIYHDGDGTASRGSGEATGSAESGKGHKKRNTSSSPSPKSGGSESRSRSSGNENSNKGLHLQAQVFPWDTEENFAYRRRLQRGEDALKTLRCEYLPSLNCICVLTSDLRINFHEVVNTHNINSDNVKPLGRIQTSSQQYVLAWDDTHGQLFTAGCSHEIVVWKVSKVKQKKENNTGVGIGGMGGKHKILATKKTVIAHHSDAIQDLLVVVDPDYELSCLLSASLDKEIHCYDLSLLRHMRTLVGHKSGISSLCYDGMGALYSGGFEYCVYVWDLESGQTFPHNKLVKGHSDSIVCVSCPVKGLGAGRLCSLDRSGKMCWWDVRRNVALENHERCIHQFNPLPQVCTTLCVVHGVENSFQYSTNGMTIMAASKKLVVFDSVDVRPTELPPAACIYNPVGHNILTVHDRDVKVWDPDTGRLTREVCGLVPSEITNVILDAKGRKAIVASQDGSIVIFNNSNFSPIARLPSHSAEVTCLVYGDADKCILTASWDRSIRVYDDSTDHSSSPASALLRSITDAHDADISQLAYFRDLSLIASGGVDGTVKIWDFQFLTLDADVTPDLETKAEVTAMKFVEPYPLLVVADSDGGITLVPVRPYLGSQRYKSVLRFDNGGSGGWKGWGSGTGSGTACSSSSGSNTKEEKEKDKNKDKSGEEHDAAASDIAASNAHDLKAMALAEEKCCACVMEVVWEEGGGGEIGNTGVRKGRHLLYTGDDRGWVRVWDLTKAIEKMQMEVPRDNQMPINNLSYNPYRRCTRDGLMYKETDPEKEKEKEKEEEIDKEPKNSTDKKNSGKKINKRSRVRRTVPQFQSSQLFPSDVPLIAAFPAHGSSVRSLQIIKSPPSLITSSSDRCVHVWDPRGRECKGVLTRGRDVDVHLKRLWDFRVDKDEMAEQRTREAEEVLRRVKVMERDDRMHSKKQARMAEEMAIIRSRTPASRKKRAREASREGGKKRLDEEDALGVGESEGKPWVSPRVSPPHTPSRAPSAKMETLDGTSPTPGQSSSFPSESPSPTGLSPTGFTQTGQESEGNLEEGDSYDDEESYSELVFHGHGPKGLIGAQWEEEKNLLFNQLLGMETWQKTPKELLREKVMKERTRKQEREMRKLREREKRKEKDLEGGVGYGVGRKKRKKKRKKKDDPASETSKVASGGSRTVITSPFRKNLPPPEPDAMSALDSIQNLGPSDIKGDRRDNSKDELGPRKGGRTNTSKIVLDLDADDPDNWGITSVNRQKRLYANLYVEKGKIAAAAGRSSIAKENLARELSVESEFMKEKLGEIRSWRGKGGNAGKRSRRRSEEERADGEESFDGAQTYENAEGAGSGEERSGEEARGDDVAGGETAGEGDKNDEDDYLIRTSPSPLSSAKGKSDRPSMNRDHRIDLHTSSVVGHYIGPGSAKTGMGGMSNLVNLNELAEQSARNREAWKKRVERFAERVFSIENGDQKKTGGVERRPPKEGDTKMRGSTKKTKLLLSPIPNKKDPPKGALGDGLGLVANNVLTLHKKDLTTAKKFAIQRHRLQASSTANGETTSERHQRLHSKKFFGPYSVKEVLIVSDVFCRVNEAKYNQGKKLGEKHDSEHVDYLKGKISLHSLFEEEDIYARPHFAKSLQQMTRNSGHKNRGMVDLDTVFAALFPYMKRSEMTEALDYIRLPELPSVDIYRQEAEGARRINLTNEKIEQLKQLFELYDADDSGTVSTLEIKDALIANRELYSQTKKNLGGTHSPTLFGDDDDTDDGGLSSILAEVNRNKSGELNFEEFCNMFKDLF